MRSRPTNPRNCSQSRLPRSFSRSRWSNPQRRRRPWSRRWPSSNSPSTERRRCTDTWIGRSTDTACRGSTTRRATTSSATTAAGRTVTFREPGIGVTTTRVSASRSTITITITTDTGIAPTDTTGDASSAATGTRAVVTGTAVEKNVTGMCGADAMATTATGAASGPAGARAEQSCRGRARSGGAGIRVTRGSNSPTSAGGSRASRKTAGPTPDCGLSNTRGRRRTATGPPPRPNGWNVRRTHDSRRFSAGISGSPRVRVEPSRRHRVSRTRTNADQQRRTAPRPTAMPGPGRSNVVRRSKWNAAQR